MVLHDKTEHLFTFNLSHFQKLIEKQLKDEASQFIRIGKSLIINRDYIYRINLAKQQLVMSDMALNQAFMLSASKEALKQLKQLLENELK
jgi:DNA-binding LytR/AlgR family response regulator